MSAPGPAVLLMARAPRPGQVRRAMIERLGQRGSAALQALLIDAAARWAHDIAPGHVHVAHDPPDAGAEVRELVGEATMFPQHGADVEGRFVAAVTRVLAQEPGPLLTIWPELAVWRASVAVGALEDLRDGADVVVGPLIDGGCYLIGVQRLSEPLFARAGQTWRLADGMGLDFRAVAAAGLELGLLRTERGLRSAGDLRAAIADPLLPPELVRALCRSAAGPP